MKKQIPFLIPLFLIFVMCQNSNKKEEIVSSLSSDTISMPYSPDYPNFRMLILDGIVNDSLHFKVFFNTYAEGNSFSISDSLKNFFVSDSAFVQIGRIKKQMRINYLRSDQRNFFNLDALLGKNSILVGWQFFENKIIEFDFPNQHIIAYEELPDVTEYSKIKIELSQSSKLTIPVQVVVQGKTLEDSVIIDTGYNGYVKLSSTYIEKQGIFTKHLYFGKSTTCSILPADTIKIGDLYVTNQNENMNILLCSNHSLGLLGTKTMENFSVILDLINYDLYLKN
jgi:predicted aspartyl protease